MTKVLITGGSGQLGQCIQAVSHKFNKLDLVFTDVDTLDICNGEDIEKFLSVNNIEYIVNCAAYTAVDKAESNQVLAEKLNSEAVSNIAHAACNHNCRFIQISTDYVFDGKAYKPYTEDCATSPVSVYGKTKLKGEKLALETNPETIIIRTAWLYSEFGANFVKTMIKLGTDRDNLGVVCDQVGSPTYAIDLAEVVLSIIDKSVNENKFHSGIYHYSNEGVCSWYDFAVNIHQISDITCAVKPVESKEYPTPAPRPFYSVLNKSKIKGTFNVDIPHWMDSLNRCLEQIKK